MESKAYRLFEASINFAFFPLNRADMAFTLRYLALESPPRGWTANLNGPPKDNIRE